VSKVFLSNLARQRDSARDKFLRSSAIRTQDHRVIVAFKIGNRPELSALPCRLLGIYKYNRSISLFCRRLWRPLQFDAKDWSFYTNCLSLLTSFSKKSSSLRSHLLTRLHRFHVPLMAFPVYKYRLDSRLAYFVVTYRQLPFDDRGLAFCRNAKHRSFCTNCLHCFLLREIGLATVTSLASFTIVVSLMARWPAD